MALRVVTDRGQPLRLGRRLDNGGEGVVYEVDEAPGLVAKVLLKPDDPAESAARVASLIRQGHSPRTARLLTGEPRRVAWPVAAVRVFPRARATADRPPDIGGFLMPDMRRWFRPLGFLTSAALQAEHLPAATWATALAAAANLARLVADLHAEDYVIGDLKLENLWVDESGNTGISDVDSFQFSDGAGFFASRARSPGYTAPECIDSPQALPDQSSDDFVLAVLIYQLLMAGMHPFYGKPADGGRYVSLDDNILRGRARLIRPGSVRIPAHAPPLSVLPARLSALFRRCFDDEGRIGRVARPPAAAWAAALDDARDPRRLRDCQVVPGHVYRIERPWCPWCDIARQTAIAGQPGYRR